MRSNIEQSTPISRMSPRERYKKPIFSGFYWLISDFLTHNTAHKSAEKAQINQQWPGPYVVEVEGRGIDTTFGNFVQINRCEKLKTEVKPQFDWNNFT